MRSGFWRAGNWILNEAVAVASFCTLQFYPDLVSFTHPPCKNEILITFPRI